MALTPETFIAWREAFGGRRFLLTIGSALINSIFLIAGILSETNYMAVLGGTVFAYLLSEGHKQALEKRNASAP